MKLFSFNKNRLAGGRKTEKKPAPADSRPPAISEPFLSEVILRPRITEKATARGLDNVYVFEVASGSGKKVVAKAFEQIYKVRPLKVNLVASPAKQVFVRGRRGRKPAVRKAYIYLGKEDKIEI